MKYSPLGPDDT